jgi:diacylglycerol O-acyltransferase / wax synthase
VERLRATHEALRAAKERHKALPAQLLQDATQFIPPAVFSRASRITFSLAATRKPIWNLVVSNVPGPQFPLYMAGARLVANYPVSVITDGMGLNITVMSYCGRLDFGIVADREQMRDVWMLIDWLREALAELLPSGYRAEDDGRAADGLAADARPGAEDEHAAAAPRAPAAADAPAETEQRPATG